MNLFDPAASSASGLLPYQEGEVCVSLDLETTGISPDTDEIIEVGAVRFRGDQVLDTFQTLVNPYRPIPQFVRELTGITQAEVNGAPPFAAVGPRVQSFIGDSPIVGQNIAFDIGFLSRRGLGLPNPRYDTREMASMLLPRLREYSLSPLALFLGIKHPRPHRALPDAQVTQRVFHALKELALELDGGILSELHLLHARAQSHLGSLFRQLQGARESARALRSASVGTGGLDMGALKRRLETPSPLRGKKDDYALDKEAIAAFFQEDGPLSRTLDSYRHRPQQVDMARAVSRAIGQGQDLVVEGGTGVGKSMAYLLPAMLFAVGKGARVVVSTNTINLQEQLIARDIPTLARALEESHPDFKDFRFSLLKGRDNYLCLRRWGHLRRGETMSPEEARMVSKVLVWLQGTSTGDRAELNLEYRDTALWSRMSAAGAVQCPPRGGEACFLRTARASAEASHLVVVNHALLLRDLAEGGGVIPDYDYVVIDEAHHLEEEATRQFGSRVSQGVIEEYIADLEGSQGVYGQARRLMAQLQAAPRAEVLDSVVQEGESLLPRLREHTNVLWATLASFLEHHHDEGDARQMLLRVTRSKRVQPEWSQVEVAWENTDLALSEVERGLDRLAKSLEGLESSELPGYDTLEMEVARSLGVTRELRTSFKSFIASPEDSQIYWLVQEARDGELSLNTAPLHVGEILQSRLFSRKEAVVLTSATLSTRGSFQHIRDRLGLEEVEELLVDSPFDYPGSVLLCVPQDMPDPNSGGYQASLQQAIAGVCRAAGGRTMVLFTSHASLQATRSGIREELEAEGYQVLAQGVDGTPRQLLTAFQEKPESVLLGTASFWEGVDIPGGALKALIVARLPFSVPTEPVFAARSQLFQDPFNQYAVPQAVLRFRQGFGRLIRGEQDRGVVVVLDRRVVSRPYGRAFMESIPRCTVSKGSLPELPQAIRQWLARNR
ncbi:MAG: hypothetical protein HYX93_05420 [Chloroflexi bacterium]|nr:hypothetical protein [Chloroflexota bacterium]